jgi:hypothetical protein
MLHISFIFDSLRVYYLVINVHEVFQAVLLNGTYLGLIIGLIDLLR